MFQEEYKKAYDAIEPGVDNIEKILERVKVEEEGEERRSRGRIYRGMRSVVLAVLVIALGWKSILPVAAAHIPAVYRLIERYIPEMADSVMPEEISSTNEGITMQVEAVEIADGTAKVLISFRDTPGSDRNLIRGEVDLYDSYNIKNPGEEWVMGGCNFLEYNAEEDKAYFQLSLTSSESYDKSRVCFQVTQILTGLLEEERSIDMSNLLTQPGEKKVSLTGIGGGKERERFPFWEGSVGDDPRPGCRVMDIVTPDGELSEDLRITGVAYDGGILRVQSCRGSLADADRHISPYLVDAEGNRVNGDCSVSWQEEIEGEKVSFEEHWFLISGEDLENCKLYATFCIRDESVKGDWRVTFSLE